MTLQEWANNRGEDITRFTLWDGAARVHVADRTRTPQANWELWHLSDYVIGGVVAGTIWLAPRITT